MNIGLILSGVFLYLLGSYTGSFRTYCKYHRNLADFQDNADIVLKILKRFNRI